MKHLTQKDVASVAGGCNECQCDDKKNQDIVMPVLDEEQEQEMVVDVMTAEDMDLLPETAL